jgi:DNA-binding NarL/FixJ family response regulator
VFYKVRHQWPEYAALMANLRFVLATGSRMEAMAVVHTQCTNVMRHLGFRPAGREETGAMIGAVTTAAEALELCDQHSPEILITTDQLEDADGLELVQEAHRRWPCLPILLVLKQLSLPRIRLAMEAGSQGILTDALILDGHVYQAMKTLLRGERFLDPALGALIQSGAAGRDPGLSARQLEVLKQLVLGDTDRAIATHLDMPYDTVKYNVKQIYSALGVSNRTSAALMAVRLGLVQVKLPDPMLSPDTVQRLLADLKVIQAT